MNAFDWVALAVVAYCARRGWRRGLVQEGIEVVGSVAGVVVAYRGQQAGADWLRTTWGVPETPGRVVAFIALGVGTILVALWCAQAAARWIRRSQAAAADAVGGACFGAAKATLFLLIGVVALVQLRWAAGLRLVDGSWTAHWLLAAAPVLYEGAREWLVPAFEGGG